MTTDHASSSVSKLDFLNFHTPDGLFVASCGTPYWVFRDLNQRLAVQLKATRERPRFSYQALSMWPVARGNFFGAVRIELGAKYKGKTRNRAGFIVRKGFRLYLKATHHVGIGVRLLILPYDLGNADRRTSFYANWQIVTDLSVGYECCCAPRPAATRAYQEEHTRPTLRLVPIEESTRCDGSDRDA